MSPNIVKVFDVTQCLVLLWFIFKTKTEKIAV